jgi:uncharacterized protein (DUF934 family)
MARPDMMVIAAGEPVEDHWVCLSDEAPPPCGDVIVSAERLSLDEAALRGHVGRLGVCLPPGTDLAVVERFLPLLSLIVVDFPAFRDGRGFGLARALRERYGYTGEIRAHGHILPDQYLFLVRCGVDTVELRIGTELRPWREALARFQVAYQPASDDAAPLSPLRRALLPTRV